MFFVSKWLTGTTSFFFFFFLIGPVLAETADVRCENILALHAVSTLCFSDVDTPSRSSPNISQI